jgi:ribonuclease BN (tRNA processing enzyme)
MLGTGNAFFGAGRAQSAILVEDRRGRWLLECGVTTPYLLKRHGIDPASIELAVVSHLHGDHFAGLALFLLAAREEEQRRSVLHLVGPRQLASRIRDLLRALYSELNVDEWPFPLEYHSLVAGESISLLGRTIRAFAAHHMHDGSALCLRVESEGKVIAFTGDTGPRANLAEVSEGADLFICECTLAEAPPLADVRHLAAQDIARLRAGWTARRVLLTHLSSESRQAAEALKGVDVAEDGMSIELP